MTKAKSEKAAKNGRAFDPKSTDWAMSDDKLPRLGIGEELQTLVAIYLRSFDVTVNETDKKTGEVQSKIRSLHVVDVNPNGAEDLRAVWGSSAIDQVLPRLPTECQVLIEYRGMGKTSDGKQFKEIDVKYPRGTELKAVQA